MEKPTTKPLVQSKTLIVNAIIGLAPLYPPIAEWVQANPTMVITIITVANMLLRLVTKDKVTLFKD